MKVSGKLPLQQGQSCSSCPSLILTDTCCVTHSAHTSLLPQQGRVHEAAVEHSSRQTLHVNVFDVSIAAAAADAMRTMLLLILLLLLLLLLLR